MLKRLLLPIFLCFLTVPGFTQTRLETNGTDFTIVAEKAIPAVVSIQVKSKRTKPSTQSRSFRSQDPFNFFGDDFFGRFFDQPQSQTPQVGQASGFFVTPDGYIMTNAHVIKNAEEIEVTLNDGRIFEGKVIGIDPNTDVAVVKIDGNNFPYLNLGDSNNLKVGQWVVAIGNPLGLQASLTVGVVSATGRNNLDIARIEDFIQTDAAINRGNSGGPLLNLKGEVIGMNTAIVTSSGTGGYMGIGFAIPSTIAHQVMNELIETGSVIRGFLGVTLQKVNQDLAEAFELKAAHGALIADIAVDSPAQEAGLKQGDVIISYNDQKVTNIGSLRNAISLMKPGTKVSLEIVRNGQTIRVPITIGEFPDDGINMGKAQDMLGMEVQNLTPELAQSLGYTEMHGVVVSNVDPSGPAAMVGIRKGALIIAVNRKDISNVEEYGDVLSSTDPKDPVLLLVKQGSVTQYISIRVR